MAYLKALSFIHKMSSRVGSDLLQKDIVKKKHLSGMIDEHYLRCILSLETLHAGSVLEALLPNIRRIEAVAREFSRISDSIFDKNLAVGKQSSKIEKSSRSLINIIEKEQELIKDSLYSKSEKYEKFA